jgi:hypothetical protein
MYVKQFPGNGVLSYCDVAGQLGSLLNCYGKDSTSADNVEMVERVDGKLFTIINVLL